MLDFIKNVHNDVKNKITKKYNKHISDLKSKVGDVPCVPGDKKCQIRKKKEKDNKINEKHKEILKRHTSLETPQSYTKVLNNHYHTGVLNRNTYSICNNNLNNASFINKYNYAKKNTDSILKDGYSKKSDIHGHHIDCSSKCIENFGTYNNNHHEYKRRKYINITVLILLIICIIFYLYFFVRDLMSR